MRERAVRGGAGAVPRDLRAGARQILFQGRAKQGRAVPGGRCVHAHRVAAICGGRTLRRVFGEHSRLAGELRHRAHTRDSGRGGDLFGDRAVLPRDEADAAGLRYHAGSVEDGGAGGGSRQPDSRAGGADGDERGRRLRRLDGRDLGGRHSARDDPGALHDRAHGAGEERRLCAFNVARGGKDSREMRQRRAHFGVRRRIRAAAQTALRERRRARRRPVRGALRQAAQGGDRVSRADKEALSAGVYAYAQKTRKS